MPASAPQHRIDPSVRELVPLINHDEQLELEAHLILTMAGRPPALLIAWVRERLSRLSPASESARQHLESWLKTIASPDKTIRWGLLFDLFVLLQLPAFRLHLHCLRLIEVPEPCRPAVLATSDLWWMEAPFLEVRMDDPEVVAQLMQVEYALCVSEQIHLELMEDPRQVHLEIVGWLWEMAHSQRSELEKLLKQLPPEPEPPAPEEPIQEATAAEEPTPEVPTPEEPTPEVPTPDESSTELGPT